jgi:hypothetical protein
MGDVKRPGGQKIHSCHRHGEGWKDCKLPVTLTFKSLRNHLVDRGLVPSATRWLRAQLVPGPAQPGSPSATRTAYCPVR